MSFVGIGGGVKALEKMFVGIDGIKEVEKAWAYSGAIGSNHHIIRY